MKKMSFTSRDLGRAADIYNQMLADKDCSVCLVIAGSTSAGGCMDLYAELVKHNMVDAIVATGATIVDMDFFEGARPQALSGARNPRRRHAALALHRPHLRHLYRRGAAPGLRPHDRRDRRRAASPRPHSLARVHPRDGRGSTEHGKKENSLVKLAYEHDVPIFCPAFTDSSAGFGLVKHQVDAMKAGKPYLTLDSIADFRELTDIKIKAGTTGLLMIGGGVPKNFAQDTVVCAEILGHDDVEVHKYAVQITVADVRDGACSSSTLQEAASWGKVSHRDGADGLCRGDLVLPLLAQRRLSSRPLEDPRQARLRQDVRLGRSDWPRRLADVQERSPG